MAALGGDRRGAGDVFAARRYDLDRRTPLDTPSSPEALPDAAPGEFRDAEGEELPDAISPHTEEFHDRPHLDPACDATPCPSVVTVILGRLVVDCTREVPLDLVVLVLRQDQNPRQSRHFRVYGPRVTPQDQTTTATAGPVRRSRSR